jgi:hypothetical protein
VTVTWNGATGTTVDLYLNRALVGQELNDRLVATPWPDQVHEQRVSAWDVTLCSNEATKTF